MKLTSVPVDKFASEHLGQVSKSECEKRGRGVFFIKQFLCTVYITESYFTPVLILTYWHIAKIVLSFPYFPFKLSLLLALASTIVVAK